MLTIPSVACMLEVELTHPSLSLTVHLSLSSFQLSMHSMVSVWYTKHRYMHNDVCVCRTFISADSKITDSVPHYPSRAHPSSHGYHAHHHMGTTPIITWVPHPSSHGYHTHHHLGTTPIITWVPHPSSHGYPPCTHPSSHEYPPCTHTLNITWVPSMYTHGQFYYKLSGRSQQVLTPHKHPLLHRLY